jgi:hypothetical protein
MVFDDDLVSNGAEGGSLAAQRLNDAVRSSLRTRGLDHCRVMVRIYANLAGLSKAVSKAKLCGADKRALAPFVASFNRSNDLFDFVDAGELKENADFKIRAMFRQFADNAQCKHIYFAACHDVGYISELTPFINNRDRITLVCTYATHREFGKLGLKMEELPHIFRTTPLPSEQQAYQHRPTTNPLAQNPFPPTSNPSIDYGGEKICHFFSKGICKYGRSCKNIHSKPSTNNSNGYQSPSDVRDWRKDSRPPVPTFQNHDFMSGAGQVPDFEALLPKEYDIPTNKIPINKSQQRLDSYMPRTSPEDHAAFLSRVGKNKLCNNHHLKGECIKGDACEYDHNPITDGIRNNLVSVARHMPCPRRNMCRVVGCTHGKSARDLTQLHLCTMTGSDTCGTVVRRKRVTSTRCYGQIWSAIKMLTTANRSYLPEDGLQESWRQSQLQTPSCDAQRGPGRRRFRPRDPLCHQGHPRGREWKREWQKQFTGAAYRRERWRFGHRWCFDTPPRSGGRHYVRLEVGAVAVICKLDAKTADIDIQHHRLSIPKTTS